MSDVLAGEIAARQARTTRPLGVSRTTKSPGLFALIALCARAGIGANFHT